MKFALYIRPEAEEDIRESYSYYQQCQVGLGNDFIISVEAAFNKITEHPEMYQEVHRGFRRLLISRFPFGVFYKIYGHKILVFAVIHTSRAPRAWQKRS
ncbi:type II toxin-antitoxin system RelE/ParE family toxin [Alteromonas pelagimontana]|uniref:Type II toxin-antitoxin system RelE/ParE family toxin n=1 Tax=Alteromonas pelagimontana TaxID=1858656 RepID=A0A6M4MC95_9ALTE|nr:type II toxin-antitoxin system RelE/ParE family toxin [Alteromonas pelagimontana]QJR80428.1 type II toxin-antitoxin system RelE/ParE family toxin [Alteromonas pelagimontana]